MKSVIFTLLFSAAYTMQIRYEDRTVIYNTRGEVYAQISNSSESSESDSESEEENVQLAKEGWHVAPDYGELDDHVVLREKDLAGKDFQEKKSGWSNPLGWTDPGEDDDLVLPMLRSKLRYDESEGPTKADNGEDDPEVVGREPDAGPGF